MMERTQLILAIVVITLFLVILITVILIRRHGHTTETSAIRSDIEGLRQQNDAEHQAMQSDIRTVKSWTLRILNRFGFLQDRE